MVLPKLNISYNTRSMITTIADRKSYTVSRNQAINTLKQFYKTSLLRLRTSLQLKYMKQFNHENLCTRRINFMVSKMKVRQHQESKLKDIMMKNLVRDLYSELVTKNKCMNKYRKKIQQTFAKSDVDKIYESWMKEKDYANKKIIEHFTSKKNGIIQKQKE